MSGNFEVRLSARAKDDLSGILHYLLTNYSRASATKAMQGINDRFSDIAKMPEAYSRYFPAGSGLDHEYRIVVSRRKYRIIYRIIIERNVVRVARILHVKMSPSKVETALEEE